MFELSCHCGAVRLGVETLPEDLGDCNCSICRRISGLWGYYTSDQVTRLTKEGKTEPYVQGDKMLEMHHCKTCGSTTHWDGIEKTEDRRMGLNFRMADPDVIKDIPTRKIDGASW